MSAFLYFIKDHSGPVLPGDLEKYGIAYAFDDEQPAIQLHQSPLGKGVLLYDELTIAPYTAKYLAAEQTWVQHDHPSVQVGMYTTGCPQEETLRRTGLISGHNVKMADQQWMVPLVRVHISPEGPREGPTRLPRRRIRMDGTWTDGPVQPLYEPLRALGDSFYDAWMHHVSESSGLSWDTPEDDAVALLQVNYKIGPVEADMLGLFSTLNEATCCLVVAVDGFLAEAWFKLSEQKKTDGHTQQQDLSSSTHGSTDCDQTTNQPTPTC